MLSFRHREQPFEKREKHWHKICGIPTTPSKNSWDNIKTGHYVETSQGFMTDRYFQSKSNTIPYDYFNEEFPCSVFRLELSPN